MMEVRRVAVGRFGPGAPANSQSLADLRRAFVPIWLLDRYQIEAAAKSLGGVDFPYVLASEPARAAPVDGRRQWAALYALLDTLSPGELSVPQQLLPVLSAGAGDGTDRQNEIEIIPTAGGPLFDPLEATEVGAVQTLNALLAPERLNRLEVQYASDSAVPAPAQLFELLLSKTLAQSRNDVGRRIATTTVLSLARVQHDAALSPTIALQLAGRLERVAEELTAHQGAGAGLGKWPCRPAQGPGSARQGDCRPGAAAARPAWHADRDGRGSLGLVLLQPQRDLAHEARIVAVREPLGFARDRREHVGQRLHLAPWHNCRARAA